MGCLSVQLEVFDFFKDDLVYDHLYYNKDLRIYELIVRRQNNIHKEGLVFGYISINFEDKITSFENLDLYNSPDILFLNQSFYLIKQSHQMMLMKKYDSQFVLKAPLTKNTTQFYIQARSLSSLSTSNKLDNQQPYSEVGSRIEAVSDELEHLSLEKMGLLTVHNTKAQQFIDINSRTIQGNNLQLEISVKDHKIPTNIYYKSEKSIVAKGITDKDISNLLVSENLVFGAMDEYDTLSLYKCQPSAVTPGSTEPPKEDFQCDDLLTKDKKYKDYKLHKQYYDTRKGLFYIFEKQEKKAHNILTTMVLVRYPFDSKINIYQKGPEVQVSPLQSMCDMKMFSERLYVLCSTEKDEVNKVTVPWIHFTVIQYNMEDQP